VTAAIVLAALGLLVGPALGVVVDRAVERERLRPHHRCTGCRSALGRASLVPVVSWFRRCSSCGRHPGWRYPATDVATAASLALVGGRFGLGWPAVAYAGFAAVLVVLSIIDLETHLLPNVITYPAFLAGLAMAVGAGVVSGDAGRIPAALVGGASAFVLLFVLHVIRPAGMGLGDVKLAPTLGLALGWLHGDPWLAVSLVLYALLLASLGGGLVGLAVNALRRRREEIPFGPALALGTLVIIAVSPSLVVAA
jgi:leader peptidase (prepilin peptidase) / N-methyltransferase